MNIKQFWTNPPPVPKTCTILIVRRNCRYTFSIVKIVYAGWGAVAVHVYVVSFVPHCLFGMCKKVTSAKIVTRPVHDSISLNRDPQWNKLGNSTFPKLPSSEIEKCKPYLPHLLSLKNVVPLLMPSFGNKYLSRVHMPTRNFCLVHGFQ